MSLHDPDLLVGATEEAIAITTHQTAKSNRAYRHLQATTEHGWTDAPPLRTTQSPAPPPVARPVERPTTMIAGRIALASSLFGLLWQALWMVEAAAPPPPISAKP